MRFNLSQNDPYTKQAKAEGYPARSIYKLKEIDETFKLLKKGQRVLDLGCAPGSWLMYIAQRVGEQGKVIGIDTNQIKIVLPKNCFFKQESIFDFGTTYDDRHMLSQKKFNVVVSDVAPKTTGMKEKDAGESLALCQRAFEIAENVLLENGAFVCKIFESQESNDFLKEIKNSFKAVKRYKPKASLKHSKEFFIVATGFSGTGSGTGADPVPLGTGSAPVPVN